MTNEERIAELNKIISEASSQRDSLTTENVEKTDIQKWEEKLGLTSEVATLATKEKTGAGF